MIDPRYKSTVCGIPPEQLAERMQRAHKAALAALPPGAGVALFVFDLGEGGGLGYIANANRDDMVKTIVEWLDKTTGGN